MGEIAKIRYTHDAVIDMILAAPEISQGDLAAHFGFSQSWMSIIINSDVFQHRLAERKAELVDPQIRATINERLDALARGSLDKLLKRLDSPLDQIKTPDLIAMAKLGVGDKNNRPAAPQTQNNLYVVALPPVAADSKSWLAGSSRPTPGVVDAIPVGTGD